MFRRLASLALLVIPGLACGQTPTAETQRQSELAKKPQWQRTLTADQAKQVAEFEQKIFIFRPLGFTSKTIAAAEAIATEREQAQGKDHWQARDARSLVHELRRVRTPEQSKQLAEAHRVQGEWSALSLNFKFEEALPLALKCVETARAALGDEDPDLLTYLRSLSLTYEGLARYQDCDNVLREILKVRVATVGDRHPLTAQSYDDLASACIKQNKTAEAEAFYQQALRIRQDVDGDRHPNTVVSLRNLADLSQRRGQLAQAEHFLRAGLSILRAADGNHQDAIAMVLNDLGAILNSQGKKSEGEPLLVEALKILRSVRGSRDLNVAACQLSLGAFYFGEKRYDEAETLSRDALATLRRSEGEQSPTAAMAMLTLAMVLDSNGKAAEAEPLVRTAPRIQRETFGDRAPLTAAPLETLASVLENQNRFSEAEPLRTQALSILLAAYGRQHVETAMALDRLGRHYCETGKLTAAEPLLREALEIRQTIQGLNDPDSIDNLLWLTTLYTDQGRYDSAFKTGREALRIAREVHGPDHFHTAVIMNAVAEVYRRANQTDQALELSSDALAIVRRSTRHSHLERANILNNHANLLAESGRSAEATVLLEESLQIYQQAMGKHTNTAAVLGNLARNHAVLNRLPEAEKMQREALQMREDLLGSTHPGVAQSLKGLAMILRMEGQNSAAEVVLRKCVRTHEASRLLHARAVERGVANEDQNPYRILASLLARTNRPREAFEALEFNLARGLLDERHNRLQLELAPADERQRSELQQQIERVKAAQFQISTQENLTAAQQEELQTLLQEGRQREEDLASLAAEISRRQVANLPAIQAALPTDAAIVTWVEGTYFTSQVEERWVCVVRKSGDPLWVAMPGTGPVGAWTKEEVNRARRMRSALVAAEPLEDIAELAHALYDQRLKLLEPHLVGVRSLYVAAVDQMAGIPIEILTDKYHISYIPSGTFLARRAPHSSRESSLLAIGDPVFTNAGSPGSGAPSAAQPLPPGGVQILQVIPGGAAAKALLKANDVVVSYADTKVETVQQLTELIGRQPPDQRIPLQIWREGVAKLVSLDVTPGKLGVSLAQEPAVQRIPAQRKSQQLLASFTRSEAWSELPGAQVEVMQLTRLFGSAAVTALTREQASKAALDTLRKDGDLARFRYVHFATHGAANNVNGFASKLILSAAPSPATQAPAPGPQELSAAEVLSEWRLDSDLVTLSACETALGREAGGDGVLGFSQAFLLAGSRSVCLSLWKVDDTATALLMDRFYRNLLGKREDGAKPMGKAAALHDAKAWLKDVTLVEATNRLGVITDGVSRGIKKGVAK